MENLNKNIIVPAPDPNLEPKSFRLYTGKAPLVLQIFAGLMWLSGLGVILQGIPLLLFFGIGIIPIVLGVLIIKYARGIFKMEAKGYKGVFILNAIGSLFLVSATLASGWPVSLNLTFVVQLAATFLSLLIFYLYKPKFEESVKTFFWDKIILIVLGALIVLFGGLYFYRYQTFTNEVNTKLKVPAQTDNTVPQNQQKLIQLPTGKIKWHFSSNDSKVFQAPVINGSTIMANSGGHLVALNLNSGDKIYDKQLNEESLGSLMLDGNSVYFGSNSGYIYSLNVANGQENWKFQADHHTDDSAIVITKNYLCFSTFTHAYSTTPYSPKLYCLNKNNGTLTWQSEKVGSSITGDYNSDTMFIYSNDVEAINAADGKIKWQNKEAGQVKLSQIYNGLLFALDYYGKIFAFDVNSGQMKTIGSTSYSFAYSFSKTIINNGILYGVDTQDGVIAYDLINAKDLWRFAVTSDSAQVPASPVVVGNIVYFGGNDATVHALDSQSGKELWKYDIGNNVELNTPAVSNNLIGVTDTWDNVYVIE